MGARVIQLADYRAKAPESAPVLSRMGGIAAFTERFHFWSGASGRRYVHTIYSLVDCPPVAAGNYLLVHRDTDGRRRVLAVGRLTNEAASLNLAHIRQRGAMLGANEVHVHLLAGAARQSRMVEMDLASGQLSTESAERVAGARH